MVDKESELVMVVHRSHIFGSEGERHSLFTDGFCPANKYNFSEQIREWAEFKKRSAIEENPEYKQPIAYSIIADLPKKRIFAYQRADDKLRYSEARLAGNWSFGFGGHIHPEDGRHGDAILTSKERELREETTISCDFYSNIVGYINLDGEDVPMVHRVHFGLLYLVHYSSELQVKSEAKHGEWISYDKACEIASLQKVDEWSRIALKPLKGLLG